MEIKVRDKRGGSKQEEVERGRSKENPKLTLRNCPTSSKMSRKTNTFLSPSNQPSLVIRAINCRGGVGERERARGGRGGGTSGIMTTETCVIT